MRQVKEGQKTSMPLSCSLCLQNGDTKPDMHVMETWSDGYTGKGVTIAIVDDGVEYTHPDLQANFVSNQQNRATFHK